MHELFIDFKKAYDSVRRQVLHNILNELGIPMKLVGLIKTCQKETCSSVRVGMFPINGLDSDSLRAGRSEDRIPVGARFPAPVQTGPGAYQTSYTTGTGSFQGVKRSGRGVSTQPHVAPRLKKV